MGDPSDDFFLVILFSQMTWCIWEAKWSPKSLQNRKKLCISNPKMQENLIVFFVIDSGRMLVERNYAICQARVHRQRGTEVAVPTAC